MQSTLSKATLGRLPRYLQFVRCVNTEKISAAQIARGLGLGEVQVRKDLASICTAGLPRVGYPAAALRQDMEKALGVDRPAPAVIVGAGRLGTALMEYDGFSDYGIQIIAGFDRNTASPPSFHGHVPVFPMQQLTGLKNVTLLSGDRSLPKLTLRGIKRNMRIIDKVRTRVEYNKKRRGIYEITNRF